MPCFARAQGRRPAGDMRVVAEAVDGRQAIEITVRRSRILSHGCELPGCDGIGRRGPFREGLNRSRS